MEQSIFHFRYQLQVNHQISDMDYLYFSKGLKTNDLQGQDKKRFYLLRIKVSNDFTFLRSSLLCRSKNQVGKRFPSSFLLDRNCLVHDPQDHHLF